MKMTQEMIFNMAMTEKRINILRDERLDILQNQLRNIQEEFANIEQSIIDVHTPESFSKHVTIWTRIKTNLENYYRRFYKEKLFPLFVPFNRKSPWIWEDASIQEFYTFDKGYFLRSWKNEQWYVLPIASGNPINGIVTVTTPEELNMKGIEVTGYYNPIIAMLAFYCDLVNGVQSVVGELHPRCDKEECTHYMVNGRCRYQDLRVPDPDSCILGIKGKEVK